MHPRASVSWNAAQERCRGTDFESQGARVRAAGSVSSRSVLHTASHCGEYAETIHRCDCGTQKGRGGNEKSRVIAASVGSEARTRRGSDRAGPQIGVEGCCRGGEAARILAACPQGHGNVRRLIQRGSFAFRTRKAAQVPSCFVGTSRDSTSTSRQTCFRNSELRMISLAPAAEQKREARFTASPTTVNSRRSWVRTKPCNTSPG